MDETVHEAPALPARRKMSGWKVAGIVAASIFASLLLIYLWITAVGNRRFAEMEKTLQEMLIENRSRDSSRPVLRGTAVPGNAWTDYAAAVKEVDGIKTDRNASGEYVGRGPKADRAKVEAQLAAHPTIFDHLRRGAGKASGQYPYAWEEGFSAKTPGLLSSQTLVNLAVCKSRFLAEEGKLREAAELLLDCCQFARDMGHNATLISEMIGSALYALALDDLREVVLSGKLSVEDLREVDRELEIVEGSFPSHAFSMKNESLCCGCGLRREEAAGGSFGEEISELARLPGLGRLMMADAFDTHRYFMRRAAELEGRPWAEIERAQREMDAELQKLWNPFSKIMIPGLLGSGRVGRERRAQIRLLRTAVHYRATGEVLALDDPFGVKLIVSRTGDHLKVWSVGKDGADDGGTGDWKPQPGKDNKDIVLEVDR